MISGGNVIGAALYVLHGKQIVISGGNINRAANNVMGFERQIMIITGSNVIRAANNVLGFER